MAAGQIAQWINVGKKIVFMGDDTWTNLFPSAFFRSYPMPSFDTKDLHSVDRACDAHLFAELEPREWDWDVLIAHFLGVDHVGIAQTTNIG